MNSSQPCTGYWPYTIAISPRKQCSTSCNSITPISRSGLRMRPHRYQGALRSWDAFMSANNKTWRMAASTNDVTLIGVMQGINGHVKRVRLIAGRHALGTVEVEEGRAAMTLTHAYEEMTPEKRPQDPHMDGTGLRFKTLDHGGEYPDTMWAVQIIAHSARTLSTPRNRNWRNPRACLICPNTGSTTCFRNR